jgi:hypothetical protein
LLLKQKTIRPGKSRNGEAPSDYNQEERDDFARSALGEGNLDPKRWGLVHDRDKAKKAKAVEDISKLEQLRYAAFLAKAWTVEARRRSAEAARMEVRKGTLEAAVKKRRAELAQEESEANSIWCDIGVCFP